MSRNREEVTLDTELQQFIYIYHHPWIFIALAVTEGNIPACKTEELWVKFGKHLPAVCNWTLIEAIKFDKKQNTFVEPYLPNHEIGIIHLAGKNNDNIRNDKNYISKIKTLDGDIIEKSLRFEN